MQITPIQNTNNHIYKPTFQSNVRVVRNKSGKMIYRNTTKFFRGDLDWEAFGKYILNKYKNTPKVNVYCYGCSDGSEPLSLAMLIKEIIPTPDKFFPIIAKDIDKTIINIAKTGKIGIDITDYNAINKFTNNKFDKYIKTSKKLLDYNTTPAEISPDLMKNIQFSVADIKDDIRTIQPKNSIIFCRNFWPYITSKEDQIKIVNNLSSMLKDNCTIVIGNFDRLVDLNDLLQSRYFKRAKNLANVYETTLKTLW